jgi:adenylate kinase family enzyme
MTLPYRRLVVIGSTSAGKSTLARALACKLDADFIELDALHWEPHWTEAPDAIFRERVEAATRATAWVVAGNYHAVRDILWPRAEAVVWLDFPLRTVFWRLFVRTFRRWWTREELWNGNHENFWKHLKIWSAEDSLFHWLFKTYWRHKREYPLLFALPEHQHLVVMRLKSQRELDTWQGRW